MSMMTFGVTAPADMEDALASYGCRGIDYGDRVDVPPDRQQMTGEQEHRTALVEHLNTSLGQHVANEAIEWFNHEGIREQDFPVVIYADPTILVMARRKGGYVYVSAWLRAAAKQKAARKLLETRG